MISQNPMLVPGSPKSDNQPQTVIKASNLHKTYLLGVEGVAALRGVSFEIRAGEFVTILGNSGGGKTTLLNILGTIDKPTKGFLVVCGEKIKSNTSDQVLSGLRLNYLGFVFQTFNLIGSLTALENVELPMTLRGGLSGDQIRSRAKQLLISVGMGHRLSHYPNQLSGGEQQRVTIARALSNEPKVLLLDQPTGDLDSKNTDNVMNILLTLNQQKKITLIMVTHDVNLKYYSDRVLRVLDGKITKEELIEEGARTQARMALAQRIESNNMGIQTQLTDDLTDNPGSASTAQLKSRKKDPSNYGVIGFLQQKQKRDELERVLEEKMHLPHQQH